MARAGSAARFVVTLLCVTGLAVAGLSGGPAVAREKPQDPAELGIVKTASPDSFATAGEAITFSYGVTNHGTVPLHDVVVTDDKISGRVCGPLTLAAGQVTTCTVRYTTTAGDVHATRIVNTASVSGLSRTGVQLRAGASISVPLAESSELSIAKATTTASFAAAGDQIVYTYTVSNTGNADLHGITVTDTKAGQVACPASVLPRGESMLCTATYTVQDSDVSAREVLNTATADGLTPSQGQVSGTSDQVRVPLLEGPALSVTKSTTTTSFAAAGNQVVYSYVVSNTGNVDMHDVAVTDSKTGAVTCPQSVLPRGQAMTCTATYLVQESDVSAREVLNTARVEGTTPAGAPVSHTSNQVRVPLLEQPALSITKSTTTMSFAAAGDPITYTYTVSNTGNVDLHGIVVFDSKAVPVSCPTVLPRGTAVECTATYTVDEADVSAGEVLNSAKVSGLTPSSGVVDGASSEVRVPLLELPALNIAKFSEEPTFTAAGQVITYTYIVSNTGNVDLHDIAVDDDLAGRVVCPTELPRGRVEACSVTYQITQADVDRGFITNRVFAAGETPSGTLVTSETTLTIGAVQAARIEILKQPNPIVYTAAGQTITYRYYVVNIGNVTLQAISVTDDRFGPVNCSPFTLAPGQIAQCTVTHQVTPTDLNDEAIVNTATVTALSPSFQPVTDSATATVQGPHDFADIFIVKSASAASWYPEGTEITYFYQVANDGDEPLENVAVADSRGVVVSCPRTELNPGASMTCTATYITSVFDLAAGAADNTATATGSTVNGDTVTWTATHSIPRSNVPAISVRKTADVTAFFSGQTITYTYHVVNNGGTALTNIAVTDDTVNVLCPFTVLGPGESENCTGTYMATPADVARGYITNNATAAAMRDGTTIGSLRVSLTIPVLLTI